MAIGYVATHLIRDDHKSDAETIQVTIEAYLNALKNKDIDVINKTAGSRLRIDYGKDDERYKVYLDKIVNVKLIRLDADIRKDDENSATVLVEYEIEFARDFIAVADNGPGLNRHKKYFDLKKTADGAWIIENIHY